MDEVFSDVGFWIALVGFIGSIVGALIAFFAKVIFHNYVETKAIELEGKRKQLLNQMLEDKRFDQRWRNLSTMSAVIGASDEETKRILVMIDARGSEKGDGKWGLIKYHPLPTQE